VELPVGDLLLRPPQRSDLPGIVAAFGDREIVRFISGVPVPYELRHAEAWLEVVTARIDAEEEQTLAIVERETGTLLGMVAVRLHEGGSIGYWLAPGARGKGVMTEAVRAVVGWARGERGIRRLTLTTHPANEASQRVAERAGFVRVGALEHEQPAYRDGTTRRALFELVPEG
jgi:RimJ/RimL family protein N-acetyltransferase